MSTVRERLLSLADEKYQQFHSGLCPGTDNIIGVRIPVLRNFAKEIARKGDFLAFLSCKSVYYEEIMLKGMLIGFIKDFDTALEKIQEFVPLIDNWAVCDTFCSGLKITKKHLKKIHELILPYLDSENEFEVRFAVVMLLDYFVTDEYVLDTLKRLQKVCHDGYYVKMAAAWAVSVCYVKYPELTGEFLRMGSLTDDFTHNKALQKITESLRVSESEKKIIRSMKRKNNLNKKGENAN